MRSGSRGRFVDMRVIHQRMDRGDARAERELRQAGRAFLRPEVVPFVEVTIVRAPEAVGPVVDVALEPIETIQFLYKSNPADEAK